MKNHLNIICTVLVLAASLLSACSGLPNYGALGPAGGNGGVSIEDLKTGWEEYDIYYTTWYSAAPAALMFDPRDNNTKLTGNAWTRVEEAADFSKLLEKVTGSFSYTRIWAIVGPQKQLLGYMITPTTQVFIKVVDEKTFYVSNLQVPPSGP